MAGSRTKSTGTKAAASKGKTTDKPKAPAKPRRAALVKRVNDTAASYMKAVDDRDPGAMAEHWHPNGVSEIVPVGIFRGPGEVREFFTGLFAALPDSSFTVERIVPDDRVAAVRWRMTGTFSGGPFLGIQPTGKRVDIRGVDMIEIEDQKIVRLTAFYDGASFARQIGLLPPESSVPDRALVGAFNTVTKARKAISARTGGNR